ncbi:MAG: PEP-CTERM sorting domain-containing protein, partial [Phycisphaerae bacterium]
NGITTAGTGVATVNLDGTLAMTANSPVTGTTWITPNIVLNVLSQGVTLNVASGVQGVVYSPFLQGPSSSTGGVTVTGGGTVVMDGTNTYTGPTTITSGTLALGTYSYTPSGASSSSTQVGSIADSSLLTIKSGGTFDISAVTATPTTLKGLAISGGTINVAMDASGNVSNIVLNSAATVSGSNIINFAAASGVTALTPGTYNLLADADGGLTGTFLFGNGATSEKYLLGSDSYMLTLANSNTLETLNVGAGAPIPEPATLGLFAIGGVALVLIGRKRRRTA